MYLEFLKPEVFDAIIVINIVLGLLLAARRFHKDIVRSFAGGRASISPRRLRIIAVVVRAIQRLLESGAVLSGRATQLPTAFGINTIPFNPSRDEYPRRINNHARHRANPRKAGLGQGTD